MYSRETLSKYIDVALNSDAANNVVSELMSELEQIPVEFVEEDGRTEELKEDLKRNLENYLPDILEDDEIYTENPNYKVEAKNFNIYNNQGKLMLKVKQDKSIEGHGALVFTVPFTNPDDKEAFLDFCDRLQKNSAVKYPKE